MNFIISQMSNNDETVVKTDNEEEIEIKIEETDEKSNKANNENDIKDKSTQPIIENKAVNELNDVERAVIVANAKNGVDMPFFDVKFFGNGKYRIVKKKPVKPTISQKVIKNNPSNNDNKVYYTNDQLLMEHIIELNSKVDKLMTKHKKLKRKYQTLSADIYVDDNEEANESPPSTENKNKTTSTEDKNKTPSTDEPINEQPKNNPQTITTKHIRQRSSWRNQLNYL